MVVDVAEVALIVGRQPGQRLHSRHEPGEHVPLRGHCLAQPNEQPLHAEDLLQLPVVGSEEDRVLELVDAVVEVGENREEAVDKCFDDLVEQPRRMLYRLAPLRETVAYIVERRRFVAVDGDEVPLAVEAVNLDEPVLVGRGAVEDEESEVVIAVDLGALPEMLRVLDRERMELEDVSENLE